MSKKFFFIFLLAMVFCFFLAGAVLAEAEDYGLGATASEAGLKTDTTLPVLIGNVIGTVLSLIGVIFFALMIYGGFLWMTAHGKEEQAKQGLDTVIAAVIGLIIILAAYTITSFVFKSVGIAGGGDNPPPPTGTCADVAKGTGIKFACMDKTKCDENTINIGLCPGGNNIVCCQPLGGNEGIEKGCCVYVIKNQFGEGEDGLFCASNKSLSDCNTSLDKKDWYGSSSCEDKQPIIQEKYGKCLTP